MLRLLREKYPTCLYQRGGNQGPEGILGAEMVLAASNALFVLDEQCTFEHVAGIPADPEANPPDKMYKILSHLMPEFHTRQK